MKKVKLPIIIAMLFTFIGCVSNSSNPIAELFNKTVYSVKHTPEHFFSGEKRTIKKAECPQAIDELNRYILSIKGAKKIYSNMAENTTPQFGDLSEERYSLYIDGEEVTMQMECAVLPSYSQISLSAFPQKKGYATTNKEKDLRLKRQEIQETKLEELKAEQRAKEKARSYDFWNQINSAVNEAGNDIGKTMRDVNSRATEISSNSHIEKDFDDMTSYEKEEYMKRHPISSSEDKNKIDKSMQDVHNKTAETTTNHSFRAKDFEDMIPYEKEEYMRTHPTTSSEEKKESDEIEEQRIDFHLEYQSNDYGNNQEEILNQDIEDTTYEPEQPVNPTSNYTPRSGSGPGSMDK